MRRVLGVVLAVTLLGGLLAACRDEPDRAVVAFLLASDTSPRWTQFDEPAFQQRVEETCPDCVYLTRNAQGDPDRQSAQLDEVLAAGADVVVLNAVSADTGEELVNRAGAVPVVAYDRFVAGADWYVSFDADAVGSQMAHAVARQLGGTGSVLVVNGAQTDANGVALKSAVHRVLARTDLTILAELDPQTWSDTEAAEWVSAQLATHPARTIDAVLAANDLQAGGVVRALADARVPSVLWPLVTGQDADLEALRRIVLGEQALTVYKAFPREAQQAADIAVTVATGGTVKGATEVEGVPGFVFEPVVVTLANLTDTVVRDGIYRPAVICRGKVLPRCEQLGII
ncbi:MAG TPA: substrate-binding domain-containing protein [Nocardioides sp.]|uniref:substrate-binding domain-containing protein n=1 Tax=Nocardioides sp. TaxID=35761 RepID=UPI002CBFFD47|nr:substrate-binding domain-containing protein [Nocardioides sp.]HQR26954.1 substrate-binding domain-containing protein [Nocardioides sp.]